jgi:TrmH family RNA methyltransferase
LVAERITSTANPRVKGFAKLKKARQRERSGLFLIEGLREVERAIEAAVEIKTLLVCRELLGADPPATVESVERLELSEGPMTKIAIRQNPPGVIAVANQFDTSLTSLQLGDAPLILIAEGVEKPGNLGAMMRTADAVGVDAVVIADPKTDVFNPNVVRASQGSLFSVPVAAASTTAVIDWARDRSLSIVGGYPAGENELWQIRMTGPVAVLVGAEDTGITPAWNDIAQPVRIPMSGAADSLNASVSAAILLFEAVRQRRS